MSARLARLVLALLIALCLGAGLRPAALAAAPGFVLVIPIEGMVDLGMSPLVRRALEQAEQNKALGVILDVNTLGGRVDAAISIRDHLLESPVRSVAFVHPRAISAGALIALAANDIGVSQGATVGAAT